MATQIISPTGHDGYALDLNLLVIADGGAPALSEAAQLAGYRVLQVGLAGAAEELASGIRLDAIALGAAGAEEDLLEAVLIRIDAAARERGMPVVASVGEAQLDMAVPHLLGYQRQILCDPSSTELASAVMLAKLHSEPRLNDATRDTETARLQRLNEEVARIADTLARLTRGEEEAARGSAPVRAPTSGYRGPESGEPDVSAAEVRSAIRARRMRDHFFKGELFADPAWDMLLDLFAAELERRRVSVSSLCIAAAVPPTTALRWIGTLHDAGLFERQADPSDRRRAYIGLSPKGLEGMRGYAGAIKRAGLSLA